MKKRKGPMDKNSPVSGASLKALIALVDNDINAILSSGHSQSSLNSSLSKDTVAHTFLRP